METVKKFQQPSSPSSAENDWITLLKDNRRSGGHPVATLVAPTRARWNMRIGHSIRSAPVLRDEILYVTSISGFLHAIHAENGAVKFKFQAGGSIHSTPSLSGDHILFGCDNGKVYAVEGRSGTKVWDFAAGAEVWTSPVVRNGTVFLRR